MRTNCVHVFVFVLKSLGVDMHTQSKNILALVLSSIFWLSHNYTSGFRIVTCSNVYIINVHKQKHTAHVLPF
jgi:hypothetical protein